MNQIVLLRHGESIWNQENRFTGWIDVPLSEKGLDEAREAGRLLRKEGCRFDVAFTSVLKRAVKTLWIILEEMDLMWIPVHRSWRLNERHYGALQGLNKAETADQLGFEQVRYWRRSYAGRPPALRADDPRSPRPDPRYAHLRPDDIPLTESLKDTVNRLLPYWHETIAPLVRSGKRIVVAAHGNSLRALIKHLDAVSDEDIMRLAVPTAIPLVYELDDNLIPTRHFYLGDPNAVEKAVQSTLEQLKFT